MSSTSATTATCRPPFSADEIEQFCQVASSLMTDMARPMSADGLPEPLKNIVAGVAALPLCDRLESLGNQLTALPGVDVDAVLDRVFTIDPRDPEDRPPAPILAPIATPIPFQISVPIIDQKPETETAGYQTLSLADLLAMRQVDVDWCVEGLIPRQGVAILGGAPGLGKSWLLLELALAHITGQPWLGRFRTKPGRVLYVDEESPPGLLPVRVKKLLKNRNHPIPHGDLQFIHQQGVCLSQPQSLKRLRHTLATHKSSLLIVDSLIRIHIGEENSASEMARVSATIKDIIREFGCTVVIADHQKKPGMGAVSQDLLLRGTTEKVAFADTLLSLTRKDGALVVEHSKSRFAVPVPSFMISIDDPSPGQTTVRILGDASAIQHQAEDEQAMILLGRLLADGSWRARPELTAAARKARVKVRLMDDLLKAQTDQGRLEREDKKLKPGRGNKTAFYRKKPDANSVSDFQSIIGTEIGNGNRMGAGDPSGAFWPESGGDMP